MVAMDPNDPESVERASAIIRQHAHMLSASIRNSIHLSWLRLKDFDAVESKYRAFLDRALHDFRVDPDGYMLSIDMGNETLNDESSGDVPNDHLEEQQVRIAVYVFWVGLTPQRRNHDTLNVELRKIMDDALDGLRDDPDSFGSEFHWTSD